MEYYVKSVISIIESNYHKLTSAEKTVADFFIHNNQNTDFSSSHIAELLYTSKATLSRFAKKIGYRGYQEFIYQYENTFEEKEEKITGNTKIVLNAYQEVLNKTYNLVDEAQIGRIVGYLNKADRVLVCGCGSSGLSAKEMEIRFMRIGIDVDSMTDSDMIKMASVFQNRRSLIFGFSISGEREEVTYLLREAYNKGAKTVLFTTNNGKKFSEYYSEVVALSSLRHLNYGNVISPQFPILIILDIIYAYYVEQNKYIRGGMMQIESVKNNNHELYVLSKPEKDQNNRILWNYNYFEDDMWETASLDCKDLQIYSNKVGNEEYKDVMIALYMLSELEDNDIGFTMCNGDIVSEEKYVGWINQILGTNYSFRKRFNLWENVEWYIENEKCEEMHISMKELFELIPKNLRYAAGGTELADLLWVINGTSSLLPRDLDPDSYAYEVWKCQRAIQEIFIKDLENEEEKILSLLQMPRNRRKSVMDPIMKKLAKFTLFLPARIVLFLYTEFTGDNFWENPMSNLLLMQSIIESIQIMRI